MLITIDGPVGTGKSTVAKKLAEALGYVYLDTGAMYRALTYALLKYSINFDDAKSLENFLDKFMFTVRLVHGVKHYFVDGEDVTTAIRTEPVTKMVSKISAIKMVRDKLVLIQRQIASGVNAVVEGRDMGTVVFPEAKIKIFLTGTPEIRAKRRFDELASSDPSLTFEKVLEGVNHRDEQDSNRALSPLKPADDAYTIDTSDLTIDGVVSAILEYKDSLKNKLK